MPAKNCDFETAKYCDFKPVTATFSLFYRLLFPGKWRFIIGPITKTHIYKCGCVLLTATAPKTARLPPSTLGKNELIYIKIIYTLFILYKFSPEAGTSASN